MFEMHITKAFQKEHKPLLVDFIRKPFVCICRQLFNYLSLKLLFTESGFGVSRIKEMDEFMENELKVSNLLYCD